MPHLTPSLHTSICPHPRRPQYALWGNKTDLSLLVDASAINPTAMAAAVAAGNASNSGGAHPYVIVDEYEQVWSHLQAARSHAVAQGRPVRMDIVLDNSGRWWVVAFVARLQPGSQRV